MNGFELAALAVEQPLKMHQAARVIRYDVIRARFLGRGASDFAHSRRNHRKFCRESATETAADFLFHFDQFEPADVLQQKPWLLQGVEFAQAVATVVEGNPGWKAST